MVDKEEKQKLKLLIRNAQSGNKLHAQSQDLSLVSLMPECRSCSGGAFDFHWEQRADPHPIRRRGLATQTLQHEQNRGDHRRCEATVELLRCGAVVLEGRSDQGLAHISCGRLVVV